MCPAEGDGVHHVVREPRWCERAALLADGKVRGKQGRLVQLKRLNKRRSLSPGSQKRMEETGRRREAEVDCRL